MFAEFREIDPRLRHFKKRRRTCKSEVCRAKVNHSAAKRLSSRGRSPTIAPPSTLHRGRMVDSQSPGCQNSGRCARQRASEVGFLHFALGEQAVAQLPLYAALLRCNRGYYA